ncbi:Myb-like DNA-binding domain family protein [Babesia bovis T2Bo]|uniref:Uncharacterized protein n=1 Tax=Babesia bovis TaxID=5865 RepID=A7ANH2_BABBO|nr:Myb-like DNA-binding domain family protein [Babesia bovis T2Bo]EDO08106.1 Myb-like DNA-binding domain family protein [Babesia bovis T2Bo]|eukprot:XP_001611674.1 hypothetical protein [Babesia bovis T2Bo]
MLRDEVSDCASSDSGDSSSSESNGHKMDDNEMGSPVTVGSVDDCETAELCESYSSDGNGNASFELLELDFLCHSLAFQERWFMECTNEIHGTTETDASEHDEMRPKLVRGWRRVELTESSFSTRVHKLRYGRSLLTLRSSPNSYGKRVWRYPWLRRRHAHYLLDGYLTSEANRLRMNKRVYTGLYRSLDERLMRYFGILPLHSLISVDDSYSDDSEVMCSLVSYIRASERMLHFLSQQSGLYAHLMLFSIISHLRRLRRFIYHNAASVMLLELTVIVVEALRLCQDHFHRFLSSYVSNTSTLYNGFCLPASVLPECLTRLYDDCLSLTKAVDSVLACAWEGYSKEVDCEQEDPVDDSSSTDMQDKSDAETVSEMSTRTVSSIDPLPVKSQALCEFQSKVLAELSQWTIALCKYTIEANKVLQGPVIEWYKCIGVVPPGTVRLFRDVTGINASIHRLPWIIHVTSSMLRKRGISTKPLEDHSRSMCRNTEDFATPDPSIGASQQFSEGLNDIEDEGLFKSPLGSQGFYESYVSGYVEPTEDVDMSPADDCGNLSVGTLEVSISLDDQDPATHSHSDSIDEEPEPGSESSVSDSAPDTNISDDQASPRPSESTVPTTKPGNKTDTVGMRRRQWKLEEVQILVDAINRHGAGRWAFFADAYFGGRRTGMQLKDKWTNLRRYNYVYQDTGSKSGRPGNWPLWRLIDSF